MNRTHRGIPGRFGLLALAALFVARPLLAQQNPAVEAARRELIGQAQDAAQAGDHPRAADLAMRAGQLRMSPPLRRLIAEEQASAGRVVDALVSAEVCVHETEADAALAGRAQHLAACQALVRQLNQQVGRVAVTVPPAMQAGVRVTIAGRELPNALIGVPYVVTPGTVIVEASAPGRDAIQRQVHVLAGTSVSVDLDFAAAPSVGVAQTASVASAAPVATPALVRRTETPPGRSHEASGASATIGSTQRVAGYAGIGLGVVALGVGGVGALVRENARVAFDGDASHCYVNAQSGAVEARVSAGLAACQSSSQAFATGNTLMMAGLIAGGVLVVVGAIVRVTAPSVPRDSRQANWACAPGVGDLGVACAVAF